MKAAENNGEIGSAVVACLERQHALVRSGGYWNCLVAARNLSALLLAQGRHPWIARLRKRYDTEGQVFHAPLIPRVRGIAATWTTHYVTCCDGMAYDPVASEAIRLERYSVEVFGEPLPLEVFVPSEELAAYLDAKGLWWPSAT